METSSGGEKPGLRNVLALGFVSFFTDLSTEMILSVLPVFIVEQLGASRAILGLIEGVADSLNYVFRAISGFLSDVLGVRKIIVVAGYAISNFAKPMFAFAKVWTHALIVRVTDRVGKGVRTSARDALLAESVLKGKLGKAFGIHRTMDQLGAVLGPVIASLIIYKVGFKGVFLSSFIPGVLALLILIFAVKEAKVKRAGRGRFLEGSKDVLTGVYPYFLAVMGLLTLSSYSFSFILVRSRDLGFSVASIPLIYALINISHTSMGIPSGYLSDRIGGLRVLAVGYLILIGTSLMILFSNSNFAFLIAAILFGLYMGIIETTQRTVVARFSNENLLGTAYGIYYLVVGITGLISNSLFGYIWDTYGYRVAFTYPILINLIGVILLLYLGGKFRRE